jgi:methylglyoxal synthase
MLPNFLFSYDSWFPKFLIVRRERSSDFENTHEIGEWQGFVRKVKQYLEQATVRINEQTKQHIKTEGQKLPFDNILSGMHGSMNSMKAEIAHLRIDALKERRDQAKERTASVKEIQRLADKIEIL